MVTTNFDGIWELERILKDDRWTKKLSDWGKQKQKLESTAGKTWKDIKMLIVFNGLFLFNSYHNWMNSILL